MPFIQEKGGRVDWTPIRFGAKMIFPLFCYARETQNIIIKVQQGVSFEPKDGRRLHACSTTKMDLARKFRERQF